MFERARGLLFVLYLIRSCVRTSKTAKFEEQLREAHERNEAAMQHYSSVAVGVPVSWGGISPPLPHPQDLTPNSDSVVLSSASFASFASFDKVDFSAPNSQLQVRVG